MLAGPAIVLLCSATALAIDAASYLLSAVALLGMRAPDGIERPDGPTDHPTLRGAADGLRFLTQHPFHHALLLLIAVPAAESAATGVLPPSCCAICTFRAAPTVSRSCCQG